MPHELALTTLRTAVATALAVLMTSCADRCDVSESGPAVTLARSLQQAQLEQFYIDGIGLTSKMRSSWIRDVEGMPASFRALKPSYIIVGRNEALAKLGGCMDAAVFLAAEADEGVILSWGENCLECRQLLWHASK